MYYRSNSVKPLAYNVLLDECTWQVRGPVRKAGFDLLNHTRLKSKPDPNYMRVASRERGVIVTRDYDFLILKGQMKHCGIVFLESEKYMTRRALDQLRDIPVDDWEIPVGHSEEPTPPRTTRENEISLNAVDELPAHYIEIKCPVCKHTWIQSDFHYKRLLKQDSFYCPAAAHQLEFVK